MAYDLGDYITTHLTFELKYLVVAATTWAAVHDPSVRGLHAPHLIVLAQDSTVVHSRNLAEFLGDPGKGDHFKRLRVHDPHPLPVWHAWVNAVHAKVLHPDPRRPMIPTGQRDDELKDELVPIAQSIVDAWREVAGDPKASGVRAIMITALDQALADGKDVERHFKIATVIV